MPAFLHLPPADRAGRTTRRRPAGTRLGPHPDNEIPGRDSYSRPAARPGPRPDIRAPPESSDRGEGKALRRSHPSSGTGSFGCPRRRGREKARPVAAREVRPGRSRLWQMTIATYPPMRRTRSHEGARLRSSGSPNPPKTGLIHRNVVKSLTRFDFLASRSAVTVGPRVFAQ